MEVKTKFNIGDTVYRIVNSYKIIKEVICNIHIRIYRNSQIEITYENESHTNINEHLLYKDIEEIITHFKQQYINITNK